MKISVALCTYNGENFLQEQLDSIAEQTLLPDELVACDDRSSDGTLQILQEFKQKAPFAVHIHRNEKNLGSTKNFEKAINLCTGEIIALCDQDDVWKPQKLERLIAELQEKPEAGYVFSNAELVDENLKPLNSLLWDSIKFSGEVRERFFNGEQIQCLIKQHIVTGATMAFHASVGKMAMPFPTSGNWIHDGWIALVATSVGAAGIPVDEPLVQYRQHSKQQIGAPASEGRSGSQLSKRKSLLQMYRDLKRHEKAYFEAWEYRGAKILLTLPVVKRKLAELKDSQPSRVLIENLNYLKRFETHFINRRKIMTTKEPGRFMLIMQEAFSGRYAEFSDSWRSIFRDLFL